MNCLFYFVKYVIAEKPSAASAAPITVGRGTPFSVP
jgi:hypothetical protein